MVKVFFLLFSHFFALLVYKQNKNGVGEVPIAVSCPQPTFNLVDIFAPHLVTLQLPQKYNGGVAGTLRCSQQSHPGFLESSISLTLVARNAGGNHVLPRMFPTARAGQDMIQSELPLDWLSAAILTGVLVSCQYRTPGKRHQTAMRDAHIIDQSDHQRHVQSQPLRAYLGPSCLYNLGLLLQEQHYGPPQRDYVERLKGGVEH